MITDIDIRNLLAEAYRRAAMHPEADMRLVAEVLEKLRTRMSSPDPYSVWKKIEVSKDQFDRPYIRNLLIDLKEDYYLLVYEQVCKEVAKALEESSEAGWNVFIHNYLDAFIQWVPLIYVKLCSAEFAFASKYHASLAKLNELNRYVLQERWLDSYEPMEELLRDYEPDARQKAYILVNLGKIELYFMSGYRDAIGRFEEAGQLLPDHPLIVRAYGEYMMVQGKFTESREYVNRAMCSDNIEVSDYLIMGDTYRDEGKAEIAEQWYHDAINLNFLEADAYLRLLGLKCTSGYTVSAGQLPELAEKIRVFDNPPEYSNSGYAAYKQLAFCYGTNGDLTREIQYYEKAIELQPNWIPAYIEYANALVARDEFEEAGKLVSKAQEIEPDAHDVVFTSGLLQEKQGNIQQAIDAYSRCASMRPAISDGLLNTIGVLYGDLGNMEKSLEYYQKAIHLRPDKSRYHSNAGYAYRQLGQLEESEKALRRAIEISPGVSEYYNNLGNLFYAQGQWEAAKSFYTMAVHGDSTQSVYLENLALVSDQMGDYAASKEYYLKAIELSPTKENWNLAGIAFYKLSDNSAAVQYYMKAIEVGGEEAVYYNNIGLAYQRENKFDKAEEAFKRAIELDPGNYKYVSRLGEVFAETDHLDKAIEQFRQAISLYDSDPAVYENLGLAFEKMGKVREAREVYEQMIAHENGSGIFLNRMGVFYYKQQQHQEAARYYNLAIEKNPLEPVYWENLGLAYEGTEQFELALEAYSKLVDLAPGKADYYFRLATPLAKQGRKHEALIIIRQGVALDPQKPELLKLQGQYEENADQVDDALATYKKGIELHPDDDYFFNRAGICCYRTGRHKEAASFYRSAINIKPDMGVYYSNLGLALDGLGECEEAIKAHQRSVELAPCMEHHNYLGIAYYNSSRFSEAIESYKKAITFDDRDAVLYANLGLALQGAERYEEAQTAFEQAISMSPDNDSYHNYLGVMFTYWQRHAEAIPHFLRATELNQSVVNYFHNLAIAYQAVQDIEMASKACETGLMVHPNNDILMLKLAELRFNNTLVNQGMQQRPETN